MVKKMEYKKMILGQWITDNTVNSGSVVEMGAGFFNMLSKCHGNVKERIGIEIYKPYIDNAKYDDCIKINGNILDHRELLKDYTPDTVMVIDVLEHLDYQTAMNWMTELKQDFNTILLMLPVGNHPQDKDLTGYGGHEYQTHRSTWTEKEISELGFHNEVIDPFFHQGTPGKDAGCYFGVWHRIIDRIT